ncbi:MAG: zinc-binding alcohol dehydrogenase family protein [Pseudomonadota bacterium]
MKAIAYPKKLANAEANVLQDVVLPDPIASGRDLLVDIKAISVNPVDTKIRRGVDAAEGEWKVLGWDGAGIVQAIGPDVTGFKPGDRVWYAGSIARPGTNSELHLVDERIVGKMPERLDFIQAAALPLTTITAWEMLFDRFCIAQNASSEKGSLLIVGAAGGVGSIMIQLASQLTGLTVIASASRPETQAWVRQMGTHHVIDHRQPLSDELQRIGIPQVEYIASLNQTDQHFAEMVKAIAPQGKIGLIDEPKSLDVLALKRKSVSLHWESMFTRSLLNTPDVARQGQMLTQLAELVDAGRIQSTVSERFGSINAANLTRAHALLESGTMRGKVVLAGF